MTRLSVRVKLYKKSKVVYQTAMLRRKAFLLKLKARFLPELIDKAYLEVRYGKDLSNRGYYFNYKDFIQAYNAFTEKSLVVDIQTGRW